MSVPLPSLLLAIGSALLGSVFVSADAALGSLSGPRVAALLEQEDLAHKATLERYHKNPWRMRATYVVGRTLCAAVSAVMFLDVVEAFIPGVLGLLVAVVATVAIYAPCSDLATAIARRNADVWGLRLASYLAVFELVFFPLTAILARVTRALSERIQEQDQPDPVVASAEVEYFVDEVERSGVVGAEPAEIIRNVLEFEDRRARDVMVPRARVEGIELSTSLAAVRRLVAESGHSRYPVYEGQLDNVVGLVVAKDVFRADLGMTDGADDGAEDAPDSHPRRLADVVRKDVIFVPEQQKLVTLLREMRQKRQHLAVVVDEFGGTSGIVTLEDVIEEIVGDIRDEHDEAEAPLQEIADGRFLAIGSLLVSDLAQYLDMQVDDSERERTLQSLFPEEVQEGATIRAFGLDLTAREVKGTAVERVEVVKAPVTVSDAPPAENARRVSGNAPKPGPEPLGAEGDSATR